MANELALPDYDNLEKLGKALAASGYFEDASKLSQAIVKVLAGLELGFGPVASMSGIHVIQGKPAVGANLMASAVKSNPRYDYRVKQLDNQACIIEFYEQGQPIGESSFTSEDAKKAGTQNLNKFPRNMLFARAMSNGVRWFCPDVFSGNTVYTPEELGATFNENNSVIESPFTVEIEKGTVPPAPPAEDGPDFEDGSTGDKLDPAVLAAMATEAQDDAPPDGCKWGEFFKAAISKLGYDNMSHVIATLEKETDHQRPFHHQTGEHVGKIAYDSKFMWMALVNHQKGKASGGNPDKGDIRL